MESLFTPRDIIDFAIQLEKNGEAVYRNAKEHTANAGLRCLLGWAADEERKHRDWFSQLREQIDTDEGRQLTADMNTALTGEYFKDQSFSLREVDFSKIVSTEKLMEVFIEFEEDTILFYQMLESFISDNGTLEKLTLIIQEEESHIRKLREYV